MRTHRVPLFVALALLALTPALRAQTFEGTIRQRTLDLDDQSIYGLLSENGLDEWEGDEAGLRAMATKLFALPVERIVEGAMDSDGPEVATIYVKGGKIRYDAGGGTYAIVDVESRTTTMVNEQARWFMTISPDDVEAAAAESQRRADEALKEMGIDPDDVAEQSAAADAESAAAHGSPAPAVRALGETREVNGISASAFEAVADGAIAVGWCAEDTWGLMKTMKEMAEQAGLLDEAASDEEDDAEADVQDAVCEGKLPVKVQMLSPRDMTAYNLDELLAIDPGSVPDAKFTVPEGYAEKKLSDLWR